MKNFRWLYVWMIGLFLCGISGIHAWGVGLGSLSYGLLLLLARPYRSLFWAGYLLHGVLHRPEKALVLYSAAYRHGVRPGAPMIAYGTLLLEREEYVLSLQVLEEVRRQKNLPPQLEKFSRMNQALACEKNGDLPAAIDILEQMRGDYESLSSDFYTTLGYFYIEAEDFDKAEVCNTRALEQEPACAAVYDNRGLMAHMCGDDAQAEQFFRRALELDGGMVSPKFQLGCIAEARGDRKTAAQFFQAVHDVELTGLSTVSRRQADEKYARLCMETKHGAG